MKIFRLIPMMILLLFFSCQSKINDEVESKNNDVVIFDDNGSGLKGTKWKIVKYVEPLTGVVKELRPEDCEDCYTMWFDTDTTVTALSIGRRTKLDLQHLNPDLRLLDKMTWCEWYERDGEDYCDAGLFFRIPFLKTGSYSATSSELTLSQHVGVDIDNEIESYLLFKRIDGEPPKTLRGTDWKLAGMVEAQTGDLKELEPKDCDECYMLQFFGDSICSVQSIWAAKMIELPCLDLGFSPTYPRGWSMDLQDFDPEPWCPDSYNSDWNGECFTYEDT